MRYFGKGKSRGRERISVCGRWGRGGCDYKMIK